MISGALRWVSERWRRLARAVRWGIISVLIVVGFLTGAVWNLAEEDGSARDNLLAFTLTYFNVVLLCGLAFVIGRNIAHLVFDVRRGILGSRLRLRLVGAFAAVAVISNIFLYVFAGGLLTNAMQVWFGSQVEESFSAAVSIAKHHYQLLRQGAQKTAEELALKLPQAPRIQKDSQNLIEWLERYRVRDRLYSLSVLSGEGEVIARSQNAAAVIETFREPEPERATVLRAAAGQADVLFEELEVNQFVRAYVPVRGATMPLVLVATVRIEPEMTASLRTVNDNFKEFKQLQLLREPLTSGYLLTLGLITLVILFGAIWVAFFLSKQLTTPIRELAQGTQRVARGDYDTTIDPVGDDEMAFLVRSFNMMLADLRNSRADAERRRVFVETVFSRLAVGIISIDGRERVTSFNGAAEKILGIPPGVLTVGVSLSDALGGVLVSHLSEMVQAVISGGGPKEREFTLTVEGAERKLVATVGQLIEDSTAPLGAILIFDDITELTKAQAMVVWREVAQRIAHEIKNPLTPIQLSAQRLQRLTKDHEVGSTAAECVGQILENVSLIKHLANEFSNFARMPTAQFKKTDLHAVIRETIERYQVNFPEVRFLMHLSTALPSVHVDPDQIQRLLINLIDNAVSATRGSTTHPQVIISSEARTEEKRFDLEVLDNGPGIPPADKVRIFEPYYTTKKGGTGLGLAIALSIVSDHQGTIRALDRTPHGTRMVVTLPFDAGSATQRRLGGAA